jgi:8-oxo-dGTP pyrophosphatase MutT (NUDIX family)
MTEAVDDARTLALVAEARERSGPAVRPRDAATLIVLDRSGPQARVLMGRRHPNHRFMPGKFVFPGGRIEPGDRVMRVAGMLSDACEARLMAMTTKPSPMRARALALAAIRETFEETGLMLGSADFGPPPAPEGAWRAFAEKGVFPDLEALTFVARAITPPGRPRRFDTRFFVADRTNVALTVDGVVGPESELDAVVWATLDQAKAMDLPAITRIVLDDLAERLAAGLPPWMPVPFYRELRGQWRRESL